MLLSGTYPEPPVIAARFDAPRRGPRPCMTRRFRMNPILGDTGLPFYELIRTDYRTTSKTYIVNYFYLVIVYIISYAIK